MNMMHTKPEFQACWLLSHFPSKSLDDLICEIYSEAFGVAFVLDQEWLDDLLDSHSDCSLGQHLRTVLGAVDEERAKQIDAGAVLSDLERLAAKELALEQLMSMEGEGLYVSGSSFAIGADYQIFACFTGYSEGQGGIRYEFDGLFASKQMAERYYKKLSDKWLEL
ncbi:hypothetical protein HAT86_06885 [Roseovarius gahaiensis]|uniref:Uncharacterized protein n=1 Tax=Roseovarius gahaiensis TaxID=2716691 RepID=A0A967BDE6_9RHOB|nr:hypothetical protein [Roseovarius gahaiensis]NHQ74189.1 hypothetical protein [Roseovarius gahaiensis]